MSSPTLRPRPYGRLLLACLLLGFLSILIIGTARLVQLTRHLAAPLFLSWDMVFLLGAAMYSVVGVLIILYHPRHAIGWLLYLIGISGLFSGFGSQYGVYSLQTGSSEWSWSLLVGMLSNTAWLLFLAPVLTLLPLLFPTGRPLSPRWAWLGWLTVAGLFVAWLSDALRPTLAFGEDNAGVYTIENPFGIPGSELLLDRLNSVSLFLLTIFALLSMASLVLRYRRGNAQARAQIKWFALGAALNLAMLLAGEYLGWDGDLLFGMLISILPVAVALAIFKYRLYDIDLLIRRTLVYSILTGLLALLYFSSVVVLQRFFATQTGQQSEIAIVISTLLIAALFTPLRGRIQKVIDRRFFRKRYDAAQVLASFSTAVRNETDPDQLTAKLLRVVNETVQPENISLWLRLPDINQRQGR